MKLIYIANIGLPTERAHGTAIMKMCEAFAKKGVSLELFVPNRKRRIAEDPFVYHSVEPAFSIQRLFSFDTASWGEIGFWISVVIFACSVSFAGLLRRKFIIYSRDEVALFFLSFLPMRIFWESHVPRFSILTRFVIHRSEGIITISRGLKTFYLNHGVPEEKILVAHSGVDVEQFAIAEGQSECRKRLFLPKDAKIIAYSGKLRTMGRNKGVEAIVESFAKVQRDIPQAFLLLVGAYSFEVSSLEDHIHSCGISSNQYKIVPHTHQGEIPFYLRSADVLVMNYPAKGHYILYMSPLKLFEYMASGTPIVSTDLPSVREVLNENNAILTEPDNSEKLAEAITMALQNSEFVDKITKQGLEDVQSYTWSERARKIIDFMQKDENQPI